jgi:hypothetical protein
MWRRIQKLVPTHGGQASLVRANYVFYASIVVGAIVGGDDDAVLAATRN